MPHDLPPWHAVYDQAQRWLRPGCFESLIHNLRAVLRLAAGRAEEPSAVVHDSRTPRSRALAKAMMCSRSMMCAILRGGACCCWRSRGHLARPNLSNWIAGCARAGEY